MFNSVYFPSDSILLILNQIIFQVKLKSIEIAIRVILLPLKKSVALNEPMHIRHIPPIRSMLSILNI